jgi:ubiquinone/menaquinone biosynthesis C-methylase UbiE
VQENDQFDEFGLPRYLDMQAEIGYTKHIGGAKATNELLELCEVGPEKVLLNVGCGAGTTSTYIVENFHCKLVGVDLKENMIKTAHERVQRKGLADKIEFRRADAQDLPFEQDTFDILICESVNIFIPDKTKAMGEYKRVVKPGGYVGLNEPVLLQSPSSGVADLISEVVGHEIFRASVWEDLLWEVGLTNVIARIYANPVREESRSQMALLDVRDILRMLRIFITMVFKSPYTRTLVKQATAASPREYMEYLGYGLFVARKEGSSLSDRNAGVKCL